jgi:hypothetical protein
MLPSGPIFGRVEEVTSPDERRLVIRQILQNAGFAGFFEGYNPFTITDDELMQKSADLPVLRIRPLGLGSGASDPAGWAWIWLWVATLGLILWIVLR